MNSQVVLLGLICLRLGGVGTHPMENKFSAIKLKNALIDEIRELDMIDKIISFEKEFENAFVSDEDYDISAELPCINLGNDGCLNGYIIGSGGNKGFLGGAGSPGK